MNEETIKLIEQLALGLGITSEHIIGEYIKWHMFSAIGWIILGTMACIAAFNIPQPKEWDTAPTQVLRIILFFIGIIVIGINAPGVIAPEGIAIHQLILDINR